MLVWSELCLTLSFKLYMLKVEQNQVSFEKSNVDQTQSPSLRIRTNDLSRTMAGSPIFNSPVLLNVGWTSGDVRFAAAPLLIRCAGCIPAGFHCLFSPSYLTQQSNYNWSIENAIPSPHKHVAYMSSAHLPITRQIYLRTTSSPAQFDKVNYWLSIKPGMFANTIRFCVSSLSIKHWPRITKMELFCNVRIFVRRETTRGLPSSSRILLFVCKMQIALVIGKNICLHMWSVLENLATLVAWKINQGLSLLLFFCCCEDGLEEKRGTYGTKNLFRPSLAHLRIMG